jgi:hypothetical protein
MALLVWAECSALPGAATVVMQRVMARSVELVARGMARPIAESDKSEPTSYRPCKEDGGNVRPKLAALRIVSAERARSPPVRWIMHHRAYSPASSEQRGAKVDLKDCLVSSECLVYFVVLTERSALFQWQRRCAS